jgi:hypothetical protein
MAEAPHANRAKPSFIVSHKLPPAEPPQAHGHFAARAQSWTKGCVDRRGERMDVIGLLKRRPMTLPFGIAAHKKSESGMRQSFKVGIDRSTWPDCLRFGQPTCRGLIIGLSGIEPAKN